jgi:hypothetical protein
MISIGIFLKLSLSYVWIFVLISIFLLFRSKQEQLENLEKAIKRAREQEKEYGRFRNYCTEYIFDKIGDTIDFNDRFNQEGMRQFIEDPDLDLTEEFFRDLNNQILSESNEIYMIHGPKGQGKSLMMLKIMEIWKKQCKELLEIEVNPEGVSHYIGFKNDEMSEIFTKLKKGYISAKDEDPGESGSGTKTNEKNLANMFYQTREKQTSFINVNPDPIDIPGVDYFLEVAGKRGVFGCQECGSEVVNPQNKTKCRSCHGELELLHHKSSTRLLWYDRRQKLLGRIYLTLPPKDKEYWNYKRKKSENIDAVIAHGGGVHNRHNKKRFERDQINFYNYCLSRNLPNVSISSLKTQLTNYNLQFDHTSEEYIGGSGDYIDDLIRNVVNALQESWDATSQTLRDHALESKEKIPKKEYNEIMEEIIEEEERLAKEEKEKLKAQKPDPLIEKLKTFHFDKTKQDIIKIARNSNNLREPERDFEIYFKIRENLEQSGKRKYKEIAYSNQYPKLNDKSSVSYAYNRVLGLISEVRGRLTEEAFYNFLKENFTEYDQIHPDGRISEPDCYAINSVKNILHVFSLKNVSLKANKGFMKIQKIQPELDFAHKNRFEYNQVRLFIILIDNSNNNSVVVKELKNFSRTKNLSFN